MGDVPLTSYTTSGTIIQIEFVADSTYNDCYCMPANKIANLMTLYKTVDTTIVTYHK